MLLIYNRSIYLITWRRSDSNIIDNNWFFPVCNIVNRTRFRVNNIIGINIWNRMYIRFWFNFIKCLNWWFISMNGLIISIWFVVIKSLSNVGLFSIDCKYLWCKHGYIFGIILYLILFCIEQLRFDLVVNGMRDEC